MNLSCLLWFLSSLILSQHLSLADEPLEKYNDEEFGIEAGEDENKEFKTKVWFIRWFHQSQISNLKIFT